MNKILSAAYSVVLAIALAFSLAGCGAVHDVASSKSAPQPAVSTSFSSAAAGSPSRAESSEVVESGEYTDKESVAEYVHLYGHLPGNYVSKTKARKAGWVNTQGNLWDVLPGKSIGGSEFYDDEDQLPDAPGRHWTECDIDYEGGYRNAKRLVFSNDGLIYYTDDHYATFERLY